MEPQAGSQSAEGGPSIAPIPKKLGGFRVEHAVGTGSFGTVYRASAVETGVMVALKVLHHCHSANPVVNERFRREAHLASRLAHEGVARLRDCDLDHQPPYIAFEFIDGTDFSQWTSERRRCGDIPAVLRCMERIAETVEYAHRNGVVHRDLKPANIKIRSDGVPVLLDFGVALELDVEVRTTRVGQLVGSPHYMSPEQHLGAPIDSRSDVWALGALLYNALTGVTPFECGSRLAVRDEVLHSEPPDPRRLNPFVPSSLVPVVQTALEKEPRYRYCGAGVVAEELRRVQAGKRTVAGNRWRRRVAKTLRRHPGAFATIGILVVATLFCGLAMDRVLRERDNVEAARLLADYEVMASLLDQEGDLWPARRTRVPDMQSWLERARSLVEREERHRGAVNADPGLREESVRQTHELVIQGMPHLRSRIDAVQERVSLVDEIEELQQQRAELWSRCIDDVARSDVYGGLHLTPQLGLLPLGVDQDSGLWEFWVPETGSRPPWGGDLLEGAVDGYAQSPESGVVLVLIPTGSFWLGAPDDDRVARANERPRLFREVGAFFAGKFEVTKAQWGKITRYDSRYSYPAERVPWETPTHPASEICWDEAVEMSWRSGLRLLTDVEWEFACRAGTTTRWFSGSTPDSLRPYANVRWSDEPRNTLVGSLLPNRYGLFDMIGNVAEWLQNKYGRYDSGPGSSLSYKRVLRGGMHSSFPEMARCSERVGASRQTREAGTGFRMARSLDPDWNWRPLFQRVLYARSEPR